MAVWGTRGEAWVGGQILLLLAWLWVPRIEPSWPPVVRTLGRIGGLVIAALGTGGLVGGIFALGRSLTPYPRPRADAALVTHGVYRWVRHPIYGGLVLLLLGFGCMSSNLARIGVALGGLLFFERKAAAEERWLVSQYPAYARYRQRVRARLVPGLY